MCVTVYAWQRSLNYGEYILPDKVINLIMTVDTLLYV